MSLASSYKVLSNAPQCRTDFDYVLDCFAEPLGNQPLKLTSHKQISNEAAQRKTEESSERSSGALLGGYREVHLLYCPLPTPLVPSFWTLTPFAISKLCRPAFTEVV